MNTETRYDGGLGAVSSVGRAPARSWPRS